MQSEKTNGVTGLETVRAALSGGRPMFLVFAILDEDGGPGVDRGMVLVAPGVPVHRLALLVGATLAKAIEAPPIVAETMPRNVREAFLKLVERALDANPTVTGSQTQGSMAVYGKPQ